MTPEAARQLVRDGVMMECGHAACSITVRDGETIPACAICAGIRSGDLKPYTIAQNPPDFTGRTARCSYSHRRDGKPCTSEEPSSPALAFFEAKPDAKHDRYYCGCWGWD